MFNPNKNHKLVCIGKNNIFIYEVENNIWLLSSQTIINDNNSSIVTVKANDNFVYIFSNDKNNIYYTYNIISDKLHKNINKISLEKDIKILSGIYCSKYDNIILFGIKKDTKDSIFVQIRYVKLITVICTQNPTKCILNSNKLFIENEHNSNRANRNNNELVTINTNNRRRLLSTDLGWTESWTDSATCDTSGWTTQNSWVYYNGPTDGTSTCLWGPFGISTATYITKTFTTGYLLQTIELTVNARLWFVCSTDGGEYYSVNLIHGTSDTYVNLYYQERTSYAACTGTWSRWTGSTSGWLYTWATGSCASNWGASYCYYDLSTTVSGIEGNEFSLKFTSNINQDIYDEGWAVSDISISYTPSDPDIRITPLVNHGTNTYLGTTQFLSYKVDNIVWGYSDSWGSIVIQSFTGYSSSIGSTTSITYCTTVSLASNEWINVVETYGGSCSSCSNSGSLYVRSIKFTTSLGNEYFCGASGYSSATYYIWNATEEWGNRHWYLSGFHSHTGAIMDYIGYRFSFGYEYTPSPTTPTVEPTDHPAKRSCLPLSDDIRAWFRGDSYDESSNLWSDKSGNGWNSYTYRGDPYLVDISFPNGKYPVIEGYSSDGILFQSTMNSYPSTVFSLCQYKPGTATSDRLRILQGYQYNWLDGHWASYTGVSHHNAWITYAYNTFHVTNWVLSVSQLSSYRSNGYSRNYYSNSYTQDPWLGINYGVFTGEYTNGYRCSELLIYDRELSTNEIIEVETYFNTIYGISNDMNYNYSFYGNYYEMDLCTESPTTSPTKYPTYEDTLTSMTPSPTSLPIDVYGPGAVYNDDDDIIHIMGGYSNTYGWQFTEYKFDASTMTFTGSTGYSSSYYVYGYGKFMQYYNGYIYWMSYSTDYLYRYDISSGSMYSVVYLSNGCDYPSMVLNKNEQTLYITDCYSNYYCYSYNISTGSFTQLPTLINSHYLSNSEIYTNPSDGNSYLYVFGGYYTTTIEKLNVNSGTSWEVLSATLGSYNRAPSVIAIPDTGYIYIIAGYYGGSYYNSILVFNCENEQIYTSSATSAYSGGLQAHVYRFPKIWIFGGYWGSSYNGIQYSNPLGTTSSPTQAPTTDWCIPHHGGSLKAWFRGDSFDDTNNIWYDKTGNGWDASTIRGDPYLVNVTFDNSLRYSEYPVIEGYVNDGIQFQANMFQYPYTLFHLIRWHPDGDTQGRIVQGYPENWLEGHHGGPKTGCCYHGQWMTPTADHHGTNWVLSSSQYSLYRSNGKQRSTTNGLNDPTYMGINYGTLDSQYSNGWQASEVIVYDKELSTSEIEEVEIYFNTVYGISSNISTDQTNYDECYVSYLSESPTDAPTMTPTNSPTKSPTNSPSNSPSDTPTNSPTNSPSNSPSNSPTNSPSYTPTDSPSNTPSNSPSNSPTDTPSNSPTNSPSNSPSNSPTNTPSNSPSNSPTNTPSDSPTNTPSNSPSNSPTNTPSNSPTNTPSNSPSNSPTNSPSNSPTNSPSNSPSNLPTNTPSNSPTNTPSNSPSNSPTDTPSNSPTNTPSNSPSNSPTNTPSNSPTNSPSNSPTNSPTNVPTNSPTNMPTNAPSNPPTVSPTDEPSALRISFLSSTDSTNRYFNPNSRFTITLIGKFVNKWAPNVTANVSWFCIGCSGDYVTFENTDDQISIYSSRVRNNTHPKIVKFRSLLTLNTDGWTGSSRLSIKVCDNGTIFEDGKEYIIGATMTVWLGDRLMGNKTKQLTVTSNARTNISSNLCYVSPTHGTSLKTKFQFICNDSYAHELFYYNFYKNGVFMTEYKTLGDGLNHENDSYSTVLGTGNHSIQAVVLDANEYGTCIDLEPISATLDVANASALLSLVDDFIGGINLSDISPSDLVTSQLSVLDTMSDFASGGNITLDDVSGMVDVQEGLLENCDTVATSGGNLTTESLLTVSSSLSSLTSPMVENEVVDVLVQTVSGNISMIVRSNYTLNATIGYLEDILFDAIIETTDFLEDYLHISVFNASDSDYLDNETIITFYVEYESDVGSTINDTNVTFIIDLSINEIYMDSSLLLETLFSIDNDAFADGTQISSSEFIVSERWEQASFYSSSYASDVSNVVVNVVDSLTDNLVNDGAALDPTGGTGLVDSVSNLISVRSGLGDTDEHAGESGDNSVALLATVGQLVVSNSEVGEAMVMQSGNLTLAAGKFEKDAPSCPEGGPSIELSQEYVDSMGSEDGDCVTSQQTDNMYDPSGSGQTSNLTFNTSMFVNMDADTPIAKIDSECRRLRRIRRRRRLGYDNCTSRRRLASDYINDTCQPILITIPNTNIVNWNESYPSCQFWNSTTEAYEGQGCFILTKNENSSTCACLHATYFGVGSDSFGVSINPITLSTFNDFTWGSFKKHPAGVLVSGLVVVLCLMTMFWLPSKDDKPLLAHTEAIKQDFITEERKKEYRVLADRIILDDKFRPILSKMYEEYN